MVGPASRSTSCTAQSSSTSVRVQSPRTSAIGTWSATPKVRSRSEKRSPPPTASEPTAAPATTRSSSSASRSRRSRRASRCSTVNTDGDSRKAKRPEEGRFARGGGGGGSGYLSTGFGRSGHPSFGYFLLRGHCAEGVDDSRAVEVIRARLALAGRGVEGEETGREVVRDRRGRGAGIRGGGGEEARLEVARGEMRLPVLGDDQGCDSGRLRRRHRGPLLPRVGRA